VARSYGNLIDLTIYRCVQEGITNALKHGQAASVVLQIIESRATGGDAPANAITLSISDTGNGVASSATTGFGLAFMRERIQSLGGSWILSANRPSGTTITVTVPLPNPSHAT
jgi:two-component system, NarL family, sensor histidine kinase UhpB